jgi:non-ribosomal peptide synthetase component E (peptide arylation enzyme)
VAMMGTKQDIDDLPKNAANYTSLTPLWFLERAAQVHPTRKSIIHGSLHYTWHQTYQRCRRFASALSNHSIGLGNTVRTSYLSFFFLHSVGLVGLLRKMFSLIRWIIVPIISFNQI